ncbi:MAG TPA: TetR/AcrR family transcriptional regulator [Solirubrobacterales bacterium]|nr:TetR/AcrR family transcriptional regulator [Solirubrobacterales bacterium]
MDGEREKIVTAIARAVAEYGYAQLTLKEVLGYAGVTSKEFEAHFQSLEQGLIAAQEAFLERLRLEVAAACDLERPWPDNVRAALEAALSYVAEANAMARGFAVEATAASLAACERQYAALETLADLLRQGRRFYPRAAQMPAATERALVGGVASIVADRLLSEEPHSLADLEPQLVEFLLVPYLGRAGASEFTQT